MASVDDKDTESSSNSYQLDNIMLEEQDAAIAIDKQQLKNSKATSSSATSSTHIKPWPEDKSAVDHINGVSSSSSSDAAQVSASIKRTNCLRNIRHALFYSYMGPILSHGAQLHKQRKKVIVDTSSNGHNNDAALSLSRRWLTQFTTRSNSHDDNDVTTMDDMERNDTMQELSKDDLYAVPTSMEAQRLADVFWSVHRQQQQAAASAIEQSSSTSNNRRNKKKNSTNN